MNCNKVNKNDGNEKGAGAAIEKKKEMTHADFENDESKDPERKKMRLSTGLVCADKLKILSKTAMIR